MSTDEAILELTKQLLRMVEQQRETIRSVSMLTDVVSRLADRVIALEARGASK